MVEKKILRQEIKRLKALTTSDDLLHRSARVLARVETNPRFRMATSVLMYWSMPGEVFTHDFIRRWSGKKTIILPIVDGNRLRLAPFDGEQSLRLNAALNLYEPQGDDYPLPQTIEVAIVPGIAFDRKLHRLGRGGGFYDRLLPQLKAYRIGVCFDFQMFDEIPSSAEDVAMDEVVCESEGLRMNEL